MFKKAIKITNSHLLSSKDKKKLKKNLKANFNKEAVDKIFDNI